MLENDKKIKMQASSISKQEHVYVRISTSGPKRKQMLMQDLKTSLDKLAATRTELYGEILISGEPIEFED